jgi:hypothetical protein
VKDKLKAMIQVDVGVCIDKLLEQNRVHKPMIAVPLNPGDPEDSDQNSFFNLTVQQLYNDFSLTLQHV